MSIENWRFYNNAAIPTTPPHVNPDTTMIESGKIWETGGVILARWSTEFDCESETNWWYVIKDTPFDISSLKSKRRYVINQGRKFFTVKKIDPREYKEELFNVSGEAYKGYPKKYRLKLKRDDFISSVNDWNYDVYGAFCKENSLLCGYALLKSHTEWIEMSVVKTVPEYEKMQINAAIVDKILEDNKEFLRSGGYICDGSRNVKHETAYQDYLEKYFCFRKAYCHLHIKYNPKIGWIVKLVYPLRGILKRFDNIGLINKVNAVLKMEEIKRGKK